VTEIGVGERSTRRILVVASALLMVIVVTVHLAFVSQGRQENFPLWAESISWFAAAVTVVTGLVAGRSSDFTVRILAIIAVVAYWATLVTFPISVPAEGIDRIPWTLSATGAAAAAALVAGGRTVAWATVLAGFTASLAFRSLFGGLDLDGAVNDFQAMFTGAVICVIGDHMLTVGRGLDAAAATTTAAVARESAEQGRFAARTRAAALVHDEVLATLTLAASGLPVPRSRLAAQALNAASMVRRLADEQAQESVTLSVALTDEARQYGATFMMRGRSTVSSTAVMDEALIGATRQALRNSVQHAPNAVRRVVLTHTIQEIVVDITDDGPGFDPTTIADDRLGIRQSIVGRMSRVAGGHADVESELGRGTTVRLRCTTPPARELPVWVGRGALREGVLVIAVVYVITQVVSAVLASIAVPGSWPLQYSMLATTLLAGEILRRSPQRRPSRGRTTVVVALVCGGLAAGVASAHLTYGMAFTYGGMWFAVAFSFLLVALALRQRITVALVSAGVVIVVLVVAGTAAGAPIGQIIQVTARPLVVVGSAVALMMVVERMQRRIIDLHGDALASAERESWSIAARSELTARVAELARTVVPLLEEIGAGEEATERQRREYARCEGELRDGLRAGVLAREPLTSAVAAARARGVDVLLLDDSGGEIDEQLIDPILLWMAAATSAAHTHVVGRLSPPGRESAASVTVDSRHIQFDPAAQLTVR
jgi:signal transduction histidine kinase